MAPVKFDDLSKTANEVLADDYQTSGFQFKAKQKTSWDGAVLTSTVDLFPPKDSTATPAKLSWKLPKPLGCTAVSVDKLELDKAGKLKLEASSTNSFGGVKLEAKSDLSVSGTVAGFTYTGLPETQVKLETKLVNPQDFALEVTRTVCPPATVGIKFGNKNLIRPDVGVRVTKGAFFASLLAKEQLSAFTAHGYHKACCGVRTAASYQYGGKGNGQFSLGLAWDVVKGTQVKAKVQQDNSVSLSVKHELSKGFTVLAGGKYDAKGGNHTYGFQLSIE